VLVATGALQLKPESAPRVRLAQAILNREILRTVVERFEGGVRRRVSPLVPATSQIKPKLRSAVGRSVVALTVTPLGWRRTIVAVVTRRAVPGAVLRYASPTVIKHAASTAIRSVGDGC
jgi:hypothetical protein